MWAFIRSHIWSNWQNMNSFSVKRSKKNMNHSNFNNYHALILRNWNWIRWCLLGHCYLILRWMSPARISSYEQKWVIYSSLKKNVKYRSTENSHNWRYNTHSLYHSTKGNITKVTHNNKWYRITAFRILILQKTTTSNKLLHNTGPKFTRLKTKNLWMKS